MLSNQEYLLFLLIGGVLPVLFSILFTALSFTIKRLIELYSSYSLSHIFTAIKLLLYLINIYSVFDSANTIFSGLPVVSFLPLYSFIFSNFILPLYCR
jgi:hypothetical protein